MGFFASNLSPRQEAAAYGRPNDGLPSQRRRRQSRNGDERLVEHVFKLFVSGDTARARNARNALHQLCEEHLAGRYEIEVIDVVDDPEQAEMHRIVVTPAVLKLLPPPPRRAVGDMRDSERVLHALQIRFGPIDIQNDEVRR